MAAVTDEQVEKVKAAELAAAKAEGKVEATEQRLVEKSAELAAAKAETKALVQQRDSLQAEVDEMRNLTHRLSDEYLDIDLLDERARDVLGLVRADEIIIR